MEENTKNYQIDKNLLMFLIFLFGFIAGVLAIEMTLQFGGLMKDEVKSNLFYPANIQQFMIPTPPGGIYISPMRTFIPTPPGG